MQTQFSETMKEQNELQSQVARAHQDIAKVWAELESSKKNYWKRPYRLLKAQTRSE